MDVQVFPIAAVSGKAMWGLLAIPAVVLLLVMGLLVKSLTGATTSTFEVSPDGMRLRGDLYGRTIPAAQVRGAEAKRIDFSQMPEIQPTRRTMGTGLPRYKAGWFRLRNGEKALLYLTDLSKAVYVPTTAGYSVIVSPAEPDAFLAAVRQIR